MSKKEIQKKIKEIENVLNFSNSTSIKLLEINKLLKEHIDNLKEIQMKENKNERKEGK